MLHIKSQLPLTQVGTPFVTAGQEEHDVPQLSMLVSDLQTPLQLWVLAGHTPLQAAFASMQTPAHSFLVPQSGMQALPLQVTVPPVGA